MNQVNGTFTEIKGSDNVSINLLMAGQDVINFAGEEMLLRMYKSIDGNILHLHTDIGRIPLGNVVGSSVHAWGPEGEGFITLTVEMERSPLIDYLMSNKIKVTGEVVKLPKGINYIVHINKAVNLGKEINLMKYLETRNATRK